MRRMNSGCCIKGPITCAMICFLGQIARMSTIWVGLGLCRGGEEGAAEVGNQGHHQGGRGSPSTGSQRAAFGQRGSCWTH